MLFHLFIIIVVVEEVLSFMIFFILILIFFFRILFNLWLQVVDIDLTLFEVLGYSWWMDLEDKNVVLIAIHIEIAA